MLRGQRGLERPDVGGEAGGLGGRQRCSGRRPGTRLSAVERPYVGADRREVAWALRGRIEAEHALLARANRVFDHHCVGQVGNGRPRGGRDIALQAGRRKVAVGGRAGGLGRAVDVARGHEMQDAPLEVGAGHRGRFSRAPDALDPGQCLALQDLIRVAQARIRAAAADARVENDVASRRAEQLDDRVFKPRHVDIQRFEDVDGPHSRFRGEDPRHQAASTVRAVGGRRDHARHRVPVCVGSGRAEVAGLGRGIEIFVGRPVPEVVRDDDERAVRGVDRLASVPRRRGSHRQQRVELADVGQVLVVFGQDFGCGHRRLIDVAHIRVRAQAIGDLVEARDGTGIRDLHDEDRDLVERADDPPVDRTQHPVDILDRRVDAERDLEDGARDPASAGLLDVLGGDALARAEILDGRQRGGGRLAGEPAGCMADEPLYGACVTRPVDGAHDDRVRARLERHLALERGPRQ